jgi:CBS domain-containing protein
MAKLLRNSTRPVISVQEDATVEDAVRTMVRHQIGAVIVLRGDEMAGIFSERDVLDKIVLARRDPATTPVFAVMTSPVVAADGNAGDAEAAETMTEHHIRHLPIVDEERKVVGVVSLRHVMEERVADLEHEVNVLEAYLGYDGVSG